MKKFVRAEVYTLVDKLKEQMVMSYSKGYQNLCKEIYMHFLIEFPLSEKLAERHLFFLIKNLEYSEPSGREIIADLLMKIVNKLPGELLGHYDETLFVTLSVRIQNEPIDDIKSKLEATIKKLLSSIEKTRQKILYEHCYSWLMDEKLKIKKSGIDVKNSFFNLF